MNELLLIASIPLVFGAVLLAYRFFGKAGLYVFTAIAAILANIEVLILVDAFSVRQTLGNVMFASTYLITDILSENYGKKAAQKSVYLGIFASIAMIIFTQSWLLFTPADTDTVFPAIRQIFSRTPRLLLASLAGYAVSQRLDVFLYHKIWDFTEKKSGDSKKFLWVRNNAATMISQIVNTVLFNFIAFYGIFDTLTLASVTVSSYVIYIFTSLLDTPFVYIARKINKS